MYIGLTESGKRTTLQPKDRLELDRTLKHIGIMRNGIRLEMHDIATESRPIRDWVVNFFDDSHPAHFSQFVELIALFNGLVVNEFNQDPARDVWTCTFRAPRS